MIQAPTSVKYYPITEDEPAFRTVHSAKESTNSFYVNVSQNVKISHKQSDAKYNDFALAKSPKSSENWYMQQNGNSQLSVNGSEHKINLNDKTRPNLVNLSEQDR